MQRKSLPSGRSQLLKRYVCRDRASLSMLCPVSWALSSGQTHLWTSPRLRTSAVRLCVQLSCSVAQSNLAMNIRC